MVFKYAKAAGLILGLALSSSAMAAEKKTANTKPVIDPAKTTGADARKAVADAKKAKAEAIRKTVAELTREFRDFARNPKEEKLRTKAEYFPSEQDEGMIEAIWSAIERPVVSEPILDAYIRWQLTSGLPELVDANHGNRLIGALHTAPRPVPGYGADARERQEFERSLRGGKAADEDAANDRLLELNRNSLLANDIILNFRDALLRRLPHAHEAIVIMLEDARLRVDKGVNPISAIKLINDNVHSWIVSDNPDAAQLTALVNLLDKSGGYKGSVVTITSVKWEKTMLVAKFGPQSIGEKVFDATLTELREALNNPNQNEVKFKDEGKSKKK